MRRVTILHVPDCPNVAVLQQRLTAVLADRADVQVELRLIDSDQGAAASGMTGSPTLLVDGVDPFAVPGQTAGLSCRLYRDDSGAIAGAPSLIQLYHVFAPHSALAQTVERGSAPVDEARCCATADLTGPGSRLSEWRARSAAHDPAGQAVHETILRAFAATGRTPTRNQLADAVAGHDTDLGDVLARLHAEDVIRLDDAGEIAAAYPFSATPTAHLVTLASGVTVSAMCAIDALGIPAMLDTDAVITSIDPITAAPVRVTISDGRYTWEPAEAVVFLSANAGVGPSADNCCAVLNFFTGSDTARAWIAANPHVPGSILTATAAEQLGQHIFGALLAEH
jgi:hypothetical protein